MTGLHGLGTLLNVTAIVIGSAIGLLIGHRLPERMRELVTDVLGLVTLLIGALSAVSITSSALRGEIGPGLPVLLVLGCLLIGGLLGSALHLEARLEQFGGWLRRRLSRGGDAPATDVSAPVATARFVEGFVDASLLFVVGPLAILGAVNDGLGTGIDQLALKSVLDGFASIALAASLGAGVMASALPVGIYQGLLTILGLVLGGILSTAQIDALTATGGVLLVAIALRMLRIRQIAVADLLPAFVLAPLAVPLLAAVT